MKLYKKALSLILSISLITIPILPIKAETAARQVEYLGRGGYAIAVDGGVYLSWRLLGTEPIGQTFDIYRNDDMAPFVSDLDATNYTDKNGNVGDVYKVTPHNGAAMENDVFIASARDYKDIILDKPEGGDGYTYEFNEASVGDVDNDGEYEFIIKWDPTNRQDNSIAGYTGNVLIDCYKQDGTKLWRVDLGKNIRAGSHYTQLMVYDFDGDGKAEMALRTTVGSKDGKGNYVSAKGAPITIDGVSYPLTWQDEYTHEAFTDQSDLRSNAGGTLGKILTGPDWLTMFNGETGEAIQTVNYYPQRGDVNSWGDDYANRSERYNAGVAYLDGVHPSLITARGYYKRAAMAAYDWNGESFTMRWHRDDKGTGVEKESSNNTHKNMNKTLYGNGDHQISVCDADNDGKDEIVFGSTVVDDNGSILNSTDHGHGDALHASDFDNDGEQEIFQVHEESFGFKEFGTEVRKAKDASIIANVGATEDVGRGLMGNFDDDYNNTSEFFSSANTNLYDLNGTLIGDAPANINPSFLIWWDGDLSREILSRTTISKYDIETNTKKNVRSFSGVHFGDKDAPALSADLLGDWREEICYPTDDNGTLRIFMTTAPTDYKMPTLMHDTQYRTAIAWQNCGYNQPPHPKFYVGKAALNSNGKYLSPTAGFDAVTMTGATPTLVYPTIQENPAGPFTVTVKAAGDISKVISSKEVEGGSEYSYGFPRYIVEDGIAYETTPTSTGTHYGGTIANVIRDTNISVIYKKAYAGVVYLEDIDKEVGNKGADVRASNCLAQDNAPYASSYKLKPGNSYTIVLGYQNSYRGSSFVADGKTLHTVTDSGEGVPKSTWGTYEINGVTVTDESPLTTVAGPNGTYDPLDTILIINETAQHIEPSTIDPTSPEGTGLSVTGTQSTTADSVVIAGVQKDDGSKAPSGYVAYTATGDGILSFDFMSSATKSSTNKPRLYYSTSESNITKNNATGFFEADGANIKKHIELSVSKGTTYYLFGYIYNMTTDFNYTLSDFAFTPWGKTYPITFLDDDDTVLEVRDVAAGAIPSDTLKPEKATDDLYTYEFTSWDKPLAEVTEAATYKAQYSRKDRDYYDVNLIPNGGTIATGKEVTRHIYGQSEPLPKSNEIVRDGYTFAGWYDNQTLIGQSISAIPQDSKGTKTYYAKWTENADEPDVEGEPLTPLGEFINKLTISKITYDDDNVELIITPKTDEPIGELTLYTAIYKDNALIQVVAGEYRMGENGKITIPLTVPQTGEGEIYKLMLWTKDMSPIIGVITN